jgi:hypothetical protein
VRVARRSMKADALQQVMMEPCSADRSARAVDIAWFPGSRLHTCGNTDRERLAGDPDLLGQRICPSDACRPNIASARAAVGDPPFMSKGELTKARPCVC